MSDGREPLDHEHEHATEPTAARTRTSYEPSHRQSPAQPDPGRHLVQASAVPLHPTLVVQLPQPGHAVRTVVSQTVWVLAIVAAVILAAGMLIVEFGGDSRDGMGRLVVDLAKVVGAPFSGVFLFHTSSGGVDTARTHLANWALAAATYLVVGRVLYRLIHAPRPVRRNR